MLTTHHIISDRWSVMVFLREMTVLYDAFLGGQSSPLPPLPIQYGDWAAWQRQQLQGERLETQLTYWQDRLGGELPVLELPWDRPRPAVPTYQGAQQPLTLSPELSAALKTLSARSNVTLFTLLLTAFKVLLHRYSQQVDIVVGSDIANRDRLRNRGTDRAAGEHPGTAQRPLGQPPLLRPAGTGSRDGAGSPGPPGLALREAGGSAQPRSPPEPDDAPVSGQAGFATGPSATPGAGRHHPGALPPGRPERQI